MRTITVRGTARIRKKPDHVSILLTLVSKDMSYSVAAADAASKLEELSRALGDAGFEPDSLKLAEYQVETKHETGRDPATDVWFKKFDGYECTQSVRLEFPLDMGRLAMALGAVEESGVNPDTRVRFTIEDEDAVADELLEEIARTAAREAEVLCRGTGTRLGRLISMRYDWKGLDLYSSSDMAVNARDSSDALMAKAGPLPASMEPEDISVGDSAVFVWEIL